MSCVGVVYMVMAMAMGMVMAMVLESQKFMVLECDARTATQS